MRYLIQLWLLLIAVASLADAPMELKYVSNTALNEGYYVKLLTRAMEVTEPAYGSFRLVHSHQAIASERMFEQLMSGELINVARISGASTRATFTSASTRINFPLMRGLMGYRVLLIREEDQERFKQVNSLDDLKKIPMGFGKGWEGYIYRHNNFSVTEPVSFDVLLKMLAGHRYDFIPLGMCEIEKSYRIDGQDITNLVPEKHLLLAYEMPMAFYVSPVEGQLAKRLQEGLDLLNKTGEANLIFDEFYAVRLKALNIKNRKIIRLVNPDLPLDHQELDLSALKNY